MNKNSVIALLIVIILFAFGCNTNTENNAEQGKYGGTNTGAGPLPSWNDGAVKQAIIAYVKSVTDSMGSHFIPTADRIATFDNDVTLWAERPYVQELFVFYMVKKMATKDSSLAK